MTYICSRKVLSGLPAAGWASYMFVGGLTGSPTLGVHFRKSSSTPLQRLIGVVSGKSAQRWRNHDHSLNAKLEQIIYIYILRQSNITMDNGPICRCTMYRLLVKDVHCYVRLPVRNNLCLLGSAKIGRVPPRERQLSTVRGFRNCNDTLASILPSKLLSEAFGKVPHVQQQTPTSKDFVHVH